MRDEINNIPPYLECVTTKENLQSYLWQVFCHVQLHLKLVLVVRYFSFGWHLLVRHGADEKYLQKPRKYLLVCAGSGGRVSTDWLYTGPASGQAAPPDDVIPVHWHWPLSVLGSPVWDWCQHCVVFTIQHLQHCSMLLSTVQTNKSWCSHAEAYTRLVAACAGTLHRPLGRSPPPAHADTMPDPSTRWGDSATILTVMSGSTRCFRSFKWSYPNILKWCHVRDTSRNPTSTGTELIIIAHCTRGRNVCCVL